MEIRAYNQYNNCLPGIDIVPQCFATLNLGCDSRYRSIVNKLDDMIELVQAQPGYNLTKEMDQLLFSMKEHFCSENNVLKLVDFPHSAAHRFDHYSIFTDTAVIHHLIDQGENVHFNRLSRIRQIFLEHIHVHDQAFEEFLVS